MKPITPLLISIAILLTLGNISSSYAATPSELSDLVGAKASGGETQLEQRGYTFIKTEKGEDRSWSNWYKASNKTCVTVVTYNGRYDSITDSPVFDCNNGQTTAKKESHTAEIAAAAVALGAIAAVAVHEHNKDKKHDQSSSVSSDINNLVGARASSAESTLRSKDYRSVSTSTGRSSKETLWWNSHRNECLSVTTADGRIDNMHRLNNSDCEKAHSNYGSQSYSPAPDITCYQNLKKCYRYGKGVDDYWTNKEFN